MHVPGRNSYNFYRFQRFLFFGWICFLIVVPFLWWPQGRYFLGGDDIKYELVNPFFKIESILGDAFTHLIPNESVLLHEVSGFFFYLALSIAKYQVPFLNTQSLVNALVLAGSFASFYWLTGQISQRLTPAIGAGAKREQGLNFVIRFVTSTLYCLSTFQIATLWLTQLPVYVYIFSVPLILGLLIKSAKKFSWWHSVFASAVLVISPSPYGCTPWTIPVVLCALPIFAILFFRKPRACVLTLALFSFTTLVLNIPILFLIGSFSAYSSGTFSANQVADSVKVFIEVNHQSSVITNMALLPNDLISKGIPVLREYPKLGDVLLFVVSIVTTGLILIATLMRLRAIFFGSPVDEKPFVEGPKNLFGGIFMAWAFCLFCYSGGGGNTYFIEMIANLMEKIPFLMMFRNNYDKFAIAISLFSSLMIYQSLVVILDWQESKREKP